MKIKNWKKFQHFKDRRPPWIKLHREILEQRDINMISDCSFRLLVNLWLLASEDDQKEGNLPSLQDIAFRLRIEEALLVNHLQELGPWIYQDDINEISKRNQVVPTETEAEAYKEETEGEAYTLPERKPKKTQPVNEKKESYGENNTVMLSKKEYLSLQNSFTQGELDFWIDRVDGYCAANGRKYKNYSAAIRNFKKKSPNEYRPKVVKISEEKLVEKLAIQEDAERKKKEWGI